MKKMLCAVLSLSFLGACHCTCNTSRPVSIIQPDTVQSSFATQPEKEELSQPINKQKTSAKPVSAALPSLTSAPTVTTKTTTTPPANKPIIAEKEVKTTVSTASASTVQNAAPVFDREQAQQVIAQARARQTLTKPQADKAVFKKEPLLPTDGRLLSPFSYEPILPDNTHAPWSNENLKYGLYYSFVKAGTAYIKNRGLTNINGKMAYLIQTTAFSASVIDSVFKVRDVNYSWLDANTFHSLGYSQSVREGNYKRDEWVTFDNKNGRFYGEIQKKEKPRAIAGHLDIEVLDMLSSLYFVRKQPLEKGKDVIFDIINREKQYPLVVKVLGKETVKTEAGKFDCWVVEPQFRGEGIFVAKGKSLKVWLTDDQYRMPVKMSVEVFIGSVYAELLEYQRN